MYNNTNPNDNSKDNNDFIAELVKQIALTEKEISEKNKIIQDIYSTQSWKLAYKIERFYSKVAPPLSFRNRIIRSIFHFCLLIYHNLYKLFRKNISFESYSYNQWIQKNEPLYRKTLQKNLNQNSATLISVVMPVYKTPTKILTETIDSVLNQDYTKWELCIANGSPKDAKIANLVENYSKKDPRIKVLNLDKNLGIAGNTNAAIKIAEGDFIAFLDHDDLLAPFALSAVINALHQYPNTDVFYSDEDKLNEDGIFRYGPFFKPAYSPDFLRAVNYICHLLVVRKSLGDQIGWLRDSFEGAQDFDLTLRAIEKARYVTHIPLILYHWRAMKGSTALSLDSKSYATTSGIKAIQEHIGKLGIEGKVIQGPFPTSYQIVYNKFKKEPLISIIIPNHNHPEDLTKCIDSIINYSTYKNIEVLIIENNSTDENIFNIYKKLETYGNIKILEYHHPFNFSKINNFAVHSAKGEVLLFLNNDTEVITKNWLDQMVAFAIRPDIGVVGAKLFYPDDTIQHGGVIIGMGGIAGHAYKGKSKIESEGILRLIVPQNYSAITGACMMMKKSIFIEIDGFDPAFQLAFGDIDLCLRIQEKGYRNVWIPYAELYHFESKTRGYENTPEKIERFTFEKMVFRKKWHDKLEEGDPYYNPNLTLNSEDCSIDPSPRFPQPRSLKSEFFR